MIAITWRYPTEFQVVVDVVDNKKIFEKRNKRSGDQDEITILDDRDGFVDLAFVDGFIAYHIEKTLYKEVA